MLKRQIHANPDLELLSNQVAECHICAEAGYYAEAFPMFRGDAVYPVAFIGQAPGNIERSRPLSFGGQAGRRLFQWLAIVGLTEEQARHFCYFSSLTKCFPGKALKGQGDRKPSPREIAYCRPYLQRELEITRPRLLIPIGGMALAPLFGAAKLSDIVGTTRQMTLAEIAAAYNFTPISTLLNEPAQVATVVPLPHPSGASRWLNDPANVALVESSLAYIRQAMLEIGLPLAE